MSDSDSSKFGLTKKRRYQRARRENARKIREIRAKLNKQVSTCVVCGKEFEYTALMPGSIRGICSTECLIESYKDRKLREEWHTI